MTTGWGSVKSPAAGGGRSREGVSVTCLASQPRHINTETAAPVGGWEVQSLAWVITSFYIEEREERDEKSFLLLLASEGTLFL